MTDTAGEIVLVTGAGGFLGSHVVRRLIKDGRKVRAFIRPTTNISAIADLPVEWAYGDVSDPEAVSVAVEGCTSVIHCVVDTKAWVRDPSSMHRVNVEGLENVMKAALHHKIKRFIFTSTIATIGINKSGVSSEEDAFNYPDLAGAYVRCRVEAERLFFTYVKEHGLPGVAMNVSNTYGPGDIAPTPHGRLLAAAAAGKLPFALKAGMACVGIEDAADAMVLAEQRGRIGERYIISDRWLTQKELYQTAATHAGQTKNLREMPLWVAYAAGFVADCISAITRKDNQLSVESIRLSHIMNDMDASKAKRELGWQPKPVLDSVREAVDFYRAARP